MAVNINNVSNLLSDEHEYNVAHPEFQCNSTHEQNSGSADDSNNNLSETPRATHQFLTEKELAAELGLSHWTVRRWRVKEGLPNITLGSRILYRLDTVLAWLDEQEQESVPEHQTSETRSVNAL